MSENTRLCTYALYNGKKKIYINVTDNLEERIEENRKDGIYFTRFEKTSKKMNPVSALFLLMDQLKRYQYGHDGKSPIANNDLYTVILEKIEKLKLGENI